MASFSVLLTILTNLRPLHRIESNADSYKKHLGQAPDQERMLDTIKEQILWVPSVPSGAR